MKKIKIIKVIPGRYGADLDEYTPIINSIIDWEEVDDKTYNKVYNAVAQLEQLIRHKQYDGNMEAKYILLVQDEEDLNEGTSIEGFLKYCKITIKEKEETVQKKQERMKKGAITRQKNKEKKEREQFEELKRKFSP